MFEKVEQELSEHFGGVIVYSRAPASGVWKEAKSEKRKTTSWFLKSWLPRSKWIGGEVTVKSSKRFFAKRKQLLELMTLNYYN
jgi:hypothetical protein